MTPVRKKGAGVTGEAPNETYVVCLDCGKQFLYDWENMRLARAVNIADGSSDDQAAASRVPFRTKSKLRYLFWGSALSAAVVLGKAVQSRKRSRSASSTEDHAQGDNDKNSQSPRTP
jgi:hypothetical protein